MKAKLLTCPSYKCPAHFPDSLMKKLIEGNEELKNKYDQVCLNSYVNDQKKVTWCSFPGCLYAVEYSVSDEIYPECNCGHKFCFRCQGEAHLPVDCDLIRKWDIKSTSESENIKWIFANCRECKKCHRTIEKVSGCNRMECAKSSGGCG